MALIPVNPNNSNNANLNQVNAIITEMNNRERVEIFKDDSGTRRVLLGKGPNGFYGLKVSQEGIDVWEASDNQLVFNSNQNVFKIVDSGTVAEASSTTAGGTTVTTYTHNLGYIPVVFAYFGGVGSEGIPMPRFSYDAGGNLDQVIILSAVNSTDITFTHSERTGSGGPFSFKFYLMQETAN